MPILDPKDPGKITPMVAAHAAMSDDFREGFICGTIWFQFSDGEAFDQRVRCSSIPFIEVLAADSGWSVAFEPVISEGYTNAVFTPPQP